MALKLTFDNNSWKEYFSITNSGTPFFVDSTFTYNNLPTLRSGVIGDGKTSQTTLSFTSFKKGYIKFSYIVSSEKNYDKFSIFLDGVTVVNNLSGTGYNWQELSYDIEPGFHTFTLKYTKDNSSAAGNDAGGIGYIEIEGIELIEKDWESKITDPLQDKVFLKKLDSENIQTYYAKIVVLNMQENPIQEITGKITAGSININGDSSVRRTCNLTFFADEGNNDLTNIDSLLSMNKKIIIYVGVENNINTQYDKIIWFKQGIFIIC